MEERLIYLINEVRKNGMGDEIAIQSIMNVLCKECDRDTARYLRENKEEELRAMLSKMF